MPKQVELELGHPLKNPHWKELAEAVFNRPETGKRYQVRFRVECAGRARDIDVLVGKVEYRTGLHVFVSGIVAYGVWLPELGHCGPQNRMRFKINYDYKNHSGILEISTFG